MAEEKLNDLSDEIKGTTAVCFFHNETIKLVVDTRESNESIRKPGSKLRVYNFTRKWYRISNHICAIMVGHRRSNYIMQYLIIEWAKNKKNAGIDIEISELVDYIETYLKGLASESTVYKFGTIIAGYDSIKDLQIYRIYIVEKEVQNQRIHMLASFGTGATYASHRMVNDYKFNFSDEEAKTFANKIIFNASFYDKMTDGNINYLEVTKEGVEAKESAQALQAYSDFYNEYDEGCTLFLVYRDKNGLIVTDDLIYLFRKHGDIIVAHNVDHRTAQEKGFYFHRLVFVSKEEAEKAWAYVTSQKVGGYESYRILSRFPYSLDWNTGRLWVEKASKNLLDFILSNSNIVLDLNPQHPAEQDA